MKYHKITEKKEPAKVIPLKSVRKEDEYRICNLCKTGFLVHSKFDRFCTECKEDSELYHFYESLPAC